MIGQKLHRIGIQFGVSRSLQLRDKSLNTLDFDGTIKETHEGTDQREQSYCGLHLQFTLDTVWSRKEVATAQCKPIKNNFYHTRADAAGFFSFPSQKTAKNCTVITRDDQ